MDIIEAMLTFVIFSSFVCCYTYAAYQIGNGVIIILKILWLGIGIIVGMINDNQNP